jgi:hypothetical protein
MISSFKGYIAVVLAFGCGFNYLKPSHAQTLPTLEPTRPTPFAVTPSTAQQAALQNLTSAQIQLIQSTVTPQLVSAINSHTAATGTYRSWQSIIANPAGASESTVNNSISSVQLPLIDSSGSMSTVTTPVREYHPATNALSIASEVSTRLSSNISSIPSRIPTSCCHPIKPFSEDIDGDGLPDSNSESSPYEIETHLANEFMPVYYISTGEQQQFANFADSVPWTVTSLVGTTPNSYYHVTPLGLTDDQNGTQMYAIRIDYLSLWNADGGMVGGGAACFYSYFGLDNVIQQLSGHDLDAERSAMLVAAPAVNGSYNPDVTTYKLYTLYTAAHEGTFFDQSAYYDFTSPVAAGNHIALAQSLSKHSTYPGNPNYYPITPAWLIAEVQLDLDLALAEGSIHDDTYLAFTAMADDTFYGCLVERFGKQGGQSPSQEVNVGEVSHPLSASSFIQDNTTRGLHLASKLTNAIF